MEKVKKENKLKNLWNYFSTYEKIWFFTITIASIVVAIILPEETTNGVSGWVITLLYLGDTLLNILCELLISKQSRWNFIISLAIEVLEIVTLIILSAMFASIATIIFFWIPIDIISFVQWTKHKDKTEEEDVTAVRKMTPMQTVLFFVLVTLWTVGIGYLLTIVSPETEFFEDLTPGMVKAVIYIDACESAIAVANGLFIMLRYREQWWTWLVVAALETAINIITGQWVLLVLKVGYFMNSIYGLIEWTKYIKTHNKEQVENSENLALQSANENNFPQTENSLKSSEEQTNKEVLEQQVGTETNNENFENIKIESVDESFEEEKNEIADATNVEVKEEVEEAKVEAKETAKPKKSTSAKKSTSSTKKTTTKTTTKKPASASSSKKSTTKKPATSTKKTTSTTKQSKPASSKSKTTNTTKTTTKKETFKIEKTENLTNETKN